MSPFPLSQSRQRVGSQKRTLQQYFICMSKIMKPFQTLLYHSYLYSKYMVTLQLTWYGICEGSISLFLDKQFIIIIYLYCKSESQ